MDNYRQRARDLVPNILLTVLSMIQALALEFYWTRLVASEFLWHGGWDALIGWLQAACVLLGILLLWLYYVSIVLRFSWLPSVSDTLFPFFLGLLEFGLIEAMHPNSIAVWLILLASMFALAIFSSHMTLGRARQDPANDYFFKQLAPRSWRNFRESIFAMSAIIFCGVALLFVESHALTLLGVCLSMAAFGYQFHQTSLYWLHSLLPAGSDDSSDPDRSDVSPDRGDH
ncbi:MAG: hypothetical protein ACI87W_002494 [Halieaceae bacterium]|jgi:hypothetical protein